MRTGSILFLFIIMSLQTVAQQPYELNSGWVCTKSSSIKRGGEELSRPGFQLSGFIPAVVPGTVLTSLLFNKQISDPFYGLNNEDVPDIYKVGREYYTYWFVNDFKTLFPAAGEDVCLYLRGVNYSFDCYLNGHKLNEQPDAGMYLRSSYNISPYLEKSGNNRLAIIVYPPDPVGNPNGGQGGDGMIAHSVTNQFVAGWDWIQPIRDRNTGIWDKIYLKRTGQVHVENTHVVTLVPGKRNPTGTQQPALVRVTAEVENTSDSTIEGVVAYDVAGLQDRVHVKLAPHSMEEVAFPELRLTRPRLWWPNGYGPQNLYTIDVRFSDKTKKVSDAEQVTFGVRQIQTPWNPKTNSREIRVNGRRIFIKGGNWILSDAMLRFSEKRYDEEVRYHRDMNLNLIRVWGGGITERPEFYNACDKYGLLVMQDFWASGDCNGRWFDPFKLEDTNARRKYPDNHQLFIESLEDQIKMLRNHPSLALWCGGNEIRPPADILTALRDTLLPSLDSTRFFFEFSNDDSMSLHGGDGPYVLQKTNYFWDHKSFPFNSEIGSVGVGDYASLQRFIPREHLIPPYFDSIGKKWVVDTVWKYHRYCGYDSSVEVYGHPATAEDFARKAQLVNYDQYRALMEGASAHLWDWYTGIIIWKTQNPWTAMVGQMYDYYLDPNACFYGTQTGAKPIHCMYNPISKRIMVVNNLFRALEKYQISVKAYTMHGEEVTLVSGTCTVPASSVSSFTSIGKAVDSARAKEGVFLALSLIDSSGNNAVDDNLYWLPDARGNYSGLQTMPTANISVSAKSQIDGAVEVTLTNPSDGPVAFFCRLALLNKNSKQRVLPLFATDNYISVLPGHTRTVTLSYDAAAEPNIILSVEGWNVPEKQVKIQ